jgi:hypothetical protein
MALSGRAQQRLAGLWGSYDFHLIRDSHFLTSEEFLERFLHRVDSQWRRSADPIDQELAANLRDVRHLLSGWA